MAKEIKINANGKSKEEIIKIIADALDNETAEEAEVKSKFGIVCEEELDKNGFSSHVELIGTQDKLYTMFVVGTTQALLDLNEGKKDIQILMDFINNLVKCYAETELSKEEE